ncbi:MAG: HesA/MoeB/ThiF family protein [Candidatus Heimdallarchaeota archaeon]|nr:HesA/MoeB/ThiF family protein [Candidatus Heimdallarchaeota archaeon]
MQDHPDWVSRFSRHFPLRSIGLENQRLLKDKKVLIAGMGGLGTVSGELLASIGVGNLVIVDFDIIETNNLPRQKLYNDSDIGKSKVDVAEERLKLRNPYLNIEVHATRLDALSVNQLLDEVDVIVDGLDSFSSRRVLHQAAYNLKIPFLFAGAIAESANIMSITFKENTPCLVCVLGNISDDPNQTCEIAGVHPSILHLAAGIQATEAIRILLDQQPNLESQMMFIDLETLEFEKIKFKKNQLCLMCGENEEGELDTGQIGDTTKGYREIDSYGKALVTSLCGRDTFILAPIWEIKWDFEIVQEKIKSQWNVKVSGANYITFEIDEIALSVMKSGVSTIRGSKSSKNAVSKFAEFYSKL